LSSGDRSGLLSHTPPTPLRHDIGNATQISLPLSLSSSHANAAFSFDQSRNENRKHMLRRANTETQTTLINSSNDFENELNILKKISKQEENLPSFIGIFGDFDTFKIPRIWFIMELCQLGPITRLLKEIQNKTQLKQSDKEKIIAYSLKGTLNALKYLHQIGIMHRGKSYYSSSI